jgi:large subunit ribosomal protein L18
MKSTKGVKRQRIRWRIRNKISGTTVSPRLSVFRSNSYIYCQLVNDQNGTTLATASSREATVDQKQKKADQAKQVGKLIAERAKSLKLEKVVFDRGGYLYHGRVKSLAEGAREGGLKF